MWYRYDKNYNTVAPAYDSEDDDADSDENGGDIEIMIN